MVTTQRFRQIKAQDRGLRKSVAPERPNPCEGVGKETTPRSGSPPPEQIDLSSPKAGFSLRIGSPTKARKSMIVGFLAMVLIPTVVLTAFIFMLSVLNTNGARSLISSMYHMLAVIAVMGLPIMVIFWAYGLYPKGSYGRFASGSIFALLLFVWLALILLGSNLQNALVDFGITLRMDKILVLVCPLAVFVFGQAISELIEDRKPWRKSMGAKVEIATLDLTGDFLDFDPHIGKLERGNSSALKAYVWFLVVPTILLVVADWILEEHDFGANDSVEASVGTMFGTVLLIGIALVLLHFVRGIYPRGSLGHVMFGLIRVPILFLFAWKIFLGSGIQEAFAQNHLIIDMFNIMLPALMYILFLAIFDISELADCRRSWHKEIGMPVEHYVPEKNYDRNRDFCLRYAMLVGGAKKGRKVLNMYAFILFIIVVLEAIVVSIYQYSNGQMISDAVKSSFTSNAAHWIHTLVILSIAYTTWMFLAWSYSAGSFARLVMYGFVSMFAAIWAYAFWGRIGDASNWSFVAPFIGYVVYVMIAIAGIRALWALRVYVKNRETYLNWRLLMLNEEQLFAHRPFSARVPEPVKASPGNLNGRGG
jgi:hypothetical protein